MPDEESTTDLTPEQEREEQAAAASRAALERLQEQDRARQAGGETSGRPPLNEVAQKRATGTKE